MDLINSFEPVSAAAGETLVSQGERGETFYAVENGELGVFIKVTFDGTLHIYDISHRYRAVESVVASSRDRTPNSRRRARRGFSRSPRHVSAAAADTNPCA